VVDQQAVNAAISQKGLVVEKERSNLIVARESSTVKGKVGGGESVVMWLQETDLAVEIASKANGSKFVTNCTRDSAANSPTIIGRFWFGARCFLRFF